MLQMSYEKLKIWQRSMDFADAVYKCTASFPREEMYGLTSQMRRAVVSIPSNIAEGSQRTSNKDFANFILTSKGSLAELHTQILIAERQGFLKSDVAESLKKEMEEISKMLYSFHRKLVTHNS